MTIAKRPSQIPGLDDLLHGGIPEGRTTLLSGKSGTGKTSVAQQILACGAKSGHRGIFVAVEEEPDDIVSGGDELGLGFSQLVESKDITVLDLRTPADATVERNGDSYLTGLVESISSTAQHVGARTVAIDSISGLFHPSPPADEVRRNVIFLIRALEKRGFTIIATVNAPSDYSRPSLYGAEDAAGLVLTLRNTVDETRRRRTLEVYKYRRSGHRKGEYPFTIASTGVTIFPVEMEGESENGADDDAGERFSSGVPGLDRMNHGGWLRDSIVLVRGPAGGGKTTLAGMYALAGAQRGECITYYGFEEPRATLLRNFERLGLKVGAAIEDGHLRVICRYPEATSSEDLLIEMRRELEERKPSLVVLDSISSIEHASSNSAFRNFLIGMASLLRRFGGSALLVQTVSPHGEAAGDAPYLSTVADAILTLDYTPDQRRLNRTMRVLKMRGSPHSEDQWKLRIQSDGVHVEPHEPEPIARTKRTAKRAAKQPTRRAKPAAKRR